MHKKVFNKKKLIINLKQLTPMKTIKQLKPLFRIALILLTISTVSVSCKKNNPAPTPTPVAVTSCFETANNGVYVGSGTASSVPFTNTPVTITKQNCTSVKIESSKFNTITVNSLTASSPGSYNGTTTSGNSLSISFTGNNCSIGGNELSFYGTK